MEPANQPRVVERLELPKCAQTNFEIRFASCGAKFRPSNAAELFFDCRLRRQSRRPSRIAGLDEVAHKSHQNARDRRVVIVEAAEDLQTALEVRKRARRLQAHIFSGVAGQWVAEDVGQMLVGDRADDPAFRLFGGPRACLMCECKTASGDCHLPPPASSLYLQVCARHFWRLVGRVRAQRLDEAAREENVAEEAKQRVANTSTAVLKAADARKQSTSRLRRARASYSWIFPVCVLVHGRVVNLGSMIIVKISNERSKR